MYYTYIQYAYILWPGKTVGCVSRMGHKKYLSQIQAVCRYSNVL